VKVNFNAGQERKREMSKESVKIGFDIAQGAGCVPLLILFMCVFAVAMIVVITVYQ
jgi:hypothetical protein